MAATTAVAALAIAGLALPLSSASVQPMAHSAALASGCDHHCHDWGGPWGGHWGGDNDFKHNKDNFNHNKNSFNGDSKAGLIVL